MPLFRRRSSPPAASATKQDRAALEWQWNEAATLAEEWAKQAQWLAGQTPHLTLAAQGAREAMRAAELARAAANASGRKAANLREEAVESAHMASKYAVGVSSSLGLSVGIFHTIANTWQRADEIANLLKSLEEQMRF